MNCSEHVMFWQYLERGCHLFSVLVTVMAFQSCDSLFTTARFILRYMIIYTSTVQVKNCKKQLSKLYFFTPNVQIPNVTSTSTGNQREINFLQYILIIDKSPAQIDKTIKCDNVTESTRCQNSIVLQFLSKPLQNTV